MMQSRVWVVSELYYPELTSTGYFLTRIAEGLAGTLPVSVLCSQPTYSSRGTRAPRREVRNGVAIRRCAGTTFSKDVLPLRLVNIATISLSIFRAALTSIRRGDVVIVVTNPPLLPFLVAFATAIKGARCILLVHDVYPEVLVATGMTSPRSLLARVAGAATAWLYRRVDRIVALGRDMKTLVDRKAAGATPSVIIPNWADVDEIVRTERAGNPLLQRLGIDDRVVLQYSGNMGRTHGLETLVEAAERMRGRPECHWLFIGWGGKREWLEGAVRERELSRVTVLEPQPRDQLTTSLGGCDVSLISFMPGMAGVSVPSRMYNVLASGRPILAIADPASEIAMLVREHGVGWVVAPGYVDDLVRTVESILAHKDELEAMGRRARQLAERECTLAKVVDQYAGLVRELQRD